VRRPSDEVKELKAEARQLKEWKQSSLSIRRTLARIGIPRSTFDPMTQRKIERYNRSMKNRILLDNYYLPGQLEQSIEEFVRYYNNYCRYHESLDNQWSKVTGANFLTSKGTVLVTLRICTPGWVRILTSRCSAGSPRWSTLLSHTLPVFLKKIAGLR
jgi:hypothetical protein